MSNTHHLIIYLAGALGGTQLGREGHEPSMATPSWQWRRRRRSISPRRAMRRAAQPAAWSVLSSVR
jgi:hypothetical protein